VLLADLKNKLETDLLMLLTVGSAWSLQPRDGLYAATGNLSYCHLSVKQCCSEYFNCYIISPTIFSLYALSTTRGIPNKGLRQQQFMVTLLLPESFSPKILYIHVSCLLVCSDNCFFLSSVYPSAREVSALPCLLAENRRHLQRVLIFAMAASQV